MMEAGTVRQWGDILVNQIPVQEQQWAHYFAYVRDLFNRVKLQKPATCNKKILSQL